MKNTLVSILFPCVVIHLPAPELLILALFVPIQIHSTGKNPCNPCNPCKKIIRWIITTYYRSLKA